jgi:hypothetical protein
LMTCLRELTWDVLIDALTHHQKVVDHPLLNLILFQSFRENITFQFIERLSTTIILVGFVSSSNKKITGISQEGNASLVVFFGVLANENWKVASQACHSHWLPSLGELNILIIFYEQVIFILFPVSKT